MTIPPDAARKLRAYGEAAGKTPVFAVGGCVRDWLLGRPTKDIDLVVEGDSAPLARRLARLLKGKAASFDAFGTHRILFKAGRVDVVRARRETYPAPAALPVVEPAGLREDLYRRDFTINAMAVSIAPATFGALEDPWGGAADLENKVLRVLHPGSFRDDPTRLFRAARFCARLGLTLDPATAGWLAGAVAQGDLFLLSRERVRQELLAILGESDPAGVFRKMKEWGAHTAFYHGFSWGDSLGKAADPLVRLGLLALHLEDAERGRGAGFLESLRLERPVAQSLAAALEVVDTQAVPRSKLPVLADKVLAAGGLPIRKRAPLLVGGDHLKKLGLKPGKAFAVLLDEAARAQFQGLFTTRPQALKWLKQAAAAKIDSPSEKR